jgi:hypothetical protein
MDFIQQGDIASIQKAFINFSLRAEKYSDEMLVDTFVDSAPMLDLLSNANSQVVYGRRGTGKTHALKYLSDGIRTRGEVPIYLDLRSVGSNTSIYSDSARALSERATQLVNDVLQGVLSALYPIAVTALDDCLHSDQITIRLDDFQSAISSVSIRGTVESETSDTSSLSSKVSDSASAKASTKDLSMELSSHEEATLSGSTSSRSKVVGMETIHIDFGNVQSSLSGLITILGVKRLWLLIDEWSEVPLELQPYLADLIRRTILPVHNCVVKIAAIEHRSSFVLRHTKGEYIGFELGADLSANLNLDDFLVFDADEQRSVQFFKNLIYRHYRKSDFFDQSIRSPDDLVQAAFTQQNVFAEFVRAVEGVPRDALNLAATMATKAFNNKITMQHVRESARDWYQRDKASVIRGSDTLSDILTIIIDEVIGTRKARAFLFPSNVKAEFIEELFDARLLHILKKNISSKDEPGSRYDVFKIDYGCYVDRINTNREPKFLFQTDDNEPVEVPKDDYRSIRRAILKPDILKRQKGKPSRKAVTRQ